MTARRPQQGVFPYQFMGPFLDLSVSRDKLQSGTFWKLDGVDGRYTGALRTFPGFTNLKITSAAIGTYATATGRGTDYIDGGAGLNSASSVYFFKYATIQKGRSEYVLRGFLIGYVVSSVAYLVFVHYDEEVAGWYSYPITSVSGENTWASTDTVDCASVGRNLVISVKGKENITVTWDDYNSSSENHIHTVAGAGTAIYLKKVNGAWRFVADITQDRSIALASGTVTVHKDAAAATGAPVSANLVPDTFNFCPLSVPRTSVLQDEYIYVLDNASPHLYGFPVSIHRTLSSSVSFHVYDDAAPEFRSAADREILYVGRTGTLRSVITGPGDPPSDLTGPTWVTTGTDTVGTSYLAGSANYTVAYRWYDPARGLYTPLSSPVQKTTGATDRCAYWSITKTALATRVQTGFSVLLLYRTIQNGGSLWLESIVNFSRDNYHPGMAGPTNYVDVRDVMAGPSITDAHLDGAWRLYVGRRELANIATNDAGHTIGCSETTSGVLDTTYQLVWMLGSSDDALVGGRAFNSVLDGSGKPPTSGIVCTYQDSLLMGGRSEDNRPDNRSTVRWSSMFAANPENFPEVDHYYAPATHGSELKTIVEAGDFAFFIRNDGAVRFHKNGTTAQVNELYRKIGSSSRYGAASVGGIVFMETPMGLLSVDGTSGRQDVVAALDRLITDPTRGWGLSRSSIRVAYDGSLGAIILFNISTREAALLWLGNGAVTSLQGVPFLYCTEGAWPDVGGPQRAWYITTTGRIFYVNDTRNGAITMATNDPSITSATMSGTVSTSAVGYLRTSNTSMNLVAAVVKNFDVHYKSGGAWVSAIITGVTIGAGYTQIEHSGGAVTADTGSTFYIAPVVMDVGAWALRGGEVVDHFARKHTTAMAISTNVLTGSAPTLEYSIRSGVGDGASADAPVLTGEVTLNDDTTQTFVALNTTGMLLFPGFKCRTAGVDLELLGAEVHGTISGSETNSALVAPT